MQGSPPRATRCCPNPAAAAGETAYAPPKAVVEMTQTQSPGLCVHWVASGAVLGTSMASSRAKQHSAFLTASTQVRKLLSAGAVVIGLLHIDGSHGTGLDRLELALHKPNATTMALGL